MLRAYKYRIYPTDEQKVMLAKTFGCCRVAYNWSLALKEKTYKETKENISKFDMQKRVVHELREEAPWMAEVSSKAVEFAVADLYCSYDNFFKGHARYPNFRSKHQRQHFHDRGHINVDFKHGLLSIPKIKDIPCVFHRRFNGRIRQVGVELCPSGRYHVSILVDDGLEKPVLQPIDPDKTLGIDTGLKHFAVLSDGQTYEPTHYAQRDKRKLKLLSRRLAKKQKGSHQFRVLKRRMARLHEHVANCRHDHIHKITHYIASENQATTICVENLNVKGMTRNKHLAYNLQDASIGEFYRQLEYKCAWSGKNYIKIDRFAPSSKMCSHCGHIYKQLTLSQRSWTCPSCGTHHDRDLNAAVNIKNIGLGLKEALPPVRRKVTPAEQPLVDDRSSEPKKPCRDSGTTDKTGKVRSKVAPMPQNFQVTNNGKSSCPDS